MTVSKKRAEAVRKCIERIDADPGEHWDPKKLAEECGMPYATFRRRFEAAVGCPVYQYIRFRRLQKSAGILRKGGDGSQHQDADDDEAEDLLHGVFLRFIWSGLRLFPQAGR